ncbi:hypothetical protein VTO73DRAFT_11393 [Trametes versicolor]
MKPPRSVIPSFTADTVRVSWTPRCRGQQPAQERVDVHGIRAVPTITAWCTSSAPSRVHEILCPRIEHDRVRQRRHADMSGEGSSAASCADCRPT